MQTPVKSGAQKRTRTHRRRVNTDTWTGDKKWHEPRRVTHRLRTLGIASPFDLPKDPYHLLKLLLLYCSGEYIFFRSKLRIISSNFGAPEPKSQGHQDNRTVRAEFEITGALDSSSHFFCNPSTPFLPIKGRPRTCTSSIFGTFQGKAS